MAKDSLLDITDILNGYCDDIESIVVDEAKKIALKAKNQLKANSPKRTGNYAKGWSINTKKGRGYVKNIVWNKTNWQLTHLLEKPHATRNGGRTTPNIHIKPIEEECIKEFEANIQNGIEGLS